MDLFRPRVKVINNGGLGRTFFGMAFNAKARRRRFFDRINRLGGNLLFGLRCGMKTPATGAGRDNFEAIFLPAQPDERAPLPIT
jgi:hypothetical protein